MKYLKTFNESINNSDIDIIKQNKSLKPMNESSNINTYYHGGDKSDDIWFHNELWLADDAEYSTMYTKNKPNPVIYEIKIDVTKLNEIPHDEVGEDFDEFDGPDESQKQEYLENGYNSYSFEIIEADILVLFDKSPIVSIRELTEEEYEKLIEVEDDIVEDDN